MKKFLLATTFLVAVSSPAFAGQGFFGGRATQDGSINMRSSTTEQFEPARGQSVTERPRPDFDPTPIEVGSFQLFPALNTAAYFDNNIYANNANVKSDEVFKVNPSVVAASNWGRHAIAFTGMADIAQYVDHTSENYTGGALQLEGRYDIAQKVWVAGKAGYQRVTEQRSSPSFVTGSAEPTQYNLTTAGVEYGHNVGQLTGKLGYDFSDYDYSPVALVTGGTLNQDSRNRDYHKFSALGEYEVSENLHPFLRGNYETRDYNTSGARSSNGYRIDGGARMDFGGITTAEAFIGYVARDYYNFAGGNKVGAFDFGGKFLWNATELTSLQGEVSRSIDETTLAGVSSYVTTGGSLTLSHELRRDIVLEANTSYSNMTYKQSARNDDNFGVGAGARYFVTRNVYGDLTYDFQKRNSNATNSDYDRHIALIRVGLQY